MRCHLVAEAGWAFGLGRILLAGALEQEAEEELGSLWELGDLVGLGDLGRLGDLVGLQKLEGPFLLVSPKEIHSSASKTTLFVLCALKTESCANN